VAPNFTLPELSGGQLSLASLRGHPVYLNIWATWCPPCRAMIPHEREMVERLKGKPFQLVSISADEKKETLTEFLAKEKMPWSHWWPGGPQAKFFEEWEIRAFPTIYVLDASGVIRYKDLRGEELEKAVNSLLKDLEPKKAG